MAAPAEIENAQHAPSDEIAPRKCGWKHGDSGYSAGQELCRKEPKNHYEPRIPLTPTGLLMEAHYTHHPAPFGYLCNGDSSAKTWATASPAFTVLGEALRGLPIRPLMTNMPVCFCAASLLRWFLFCSVAASQHRTPRRNRRPPRQRQQARSL